MERGPRRCTFFFFNDTATTEIYALSLHDALPIFQAGRAPRDGDPIFGAFYFPNNASVAFNAYALGGSCGIGTVLVLLFNRSDEHTSELQSRQYLVCRLLLAQKTPLFRMPPSPFTN